MQKSMRWEGPGRIVVDGSLAFPGHASLWFRGDQWGGTLNIDSVAPLDQVAQLAIDFELRGQGRRRVEILDLASIPGIASRTATIVRFRGLDPLTVPGDDVH